jgi:hypothetical protein
MNFSLSHIPARTAKPREEGLTMVMDKGLSLRQVDDLIETSGGLVDLVKLGFGTSYLMPRLKDKVKRYRMPVSGSIWAAPFSRPSSRGPVRRLPQAAQRAEARLRRGERRQHHAPARREVQATSTCWLRTTRC